LAEKRAIVEQTQVRGTSVAEVAQYHGINANVVFGCRRLHGQGLAPEPASRIDEKSCPAREARLA